jgi:hypothetical protein
MIHDLVFGDAVEKFLFVFLLSYRNRMVPHNIARPVTPSLLSGAAESALTGSMSNQSAR